MAKVKDIKGGTIAQVAATTIDNNTMYAVTDFPQGGITNAQMTAALTSAQAGFYKDGDTFVCLDSGTYTQNKFYKFTITNNVPSWTEVQVGGMAVLTDTTDPTTATVGAVGQFYLNTATPKLFQCTAVEGSTYTWTAVGGGLSVLSGSGFPTTSTVGELGQIYISNNPRSIWQCSGTLAGFYNWINTGGGAFNAYNRSYFAGGAVPTPTGTNSIAIGDQATAGTHSFAVGTQAYANNSESVQLLYGTNNTANTLQIRGDNIYNHSTHTATFQNILQNNNSVYGILSGASAPTTSTVGAVGQMYVETTTPALYYCSAVVSGDPTTYTWTQAGGGGATTETATISSWTALSSSSPYTHQATFTATTTIGATSVVELYNNNAVLFATYGFAIGSISGQSVTIYSIGEPSSSVTLTIGIGG